MWDWWFFSPSLSWFWGLAVYVYLTFSVYIIANKTSTPNAWLAWIPIAHLYLTCKIADRPGWWTILYFIPLVNIVISIIIWMGIAQAREKPSWLGALIIIPVIDLVIPGILAFA